MMMEISPSTHNIDAETRSVAFQVFGKRSDPGGALVQIGGVAKEFEKHGIQFALLRIGGPRWELEWDREIPETMSVRLNIRAERGGAVSLRLYRELVEDESPPPQLSAPVEPPGEEWLAAKMKELMAAGHEPGPAARQAQELFVAEKARHERESSQIDQGKLAARMASLMGKGVDAAKAAEIAQGEQRAEQRAEQAEEEAS